jgi:hypothetical protein
MKTFTKLLGIILFFSMLVFLITGCDWFALPEFPEEIRGTWVRAEPSIYTSTRTFTENTLKISVQAGYWVLESVSGDTYTLSQSDYRENKYKPTIRLVNGKLEYSGCAGSYHDHNEYCNGTWIRQ